MILSIQNTISEAGIILMFLQHDITPLFLKTARNKCMQILPATRSRMQKLIKVGIFRHLIAELRRPEGPPSGAP